MEVPLSAEQAAQLDKIAGRTGRAAGELVRDAVNLLLDENTRFLDAVEAGFSSLDRGNYVTHDDVRNRIDTILRS